MAVLALLFGVNKSSDRVFKLFITTGDNCQYYIILWYAHTILTTHETVAHRNDSTVATQFLSTFPGPNLLNLLTAV